MYLFFHFFFELFSVSVLRGLMVTLDVLPSLKKALEWCLFEEGAYLNLNGALIRRGRLFEGRAFSKVVLFRRGCLLEGVLV